MDVAKASLAYLHGKSVLCNALNKRLASSGVFLTQQDADFLLKQRLEALALHERVEFGSPAIIQIAEAVAPLVAFTSNNAVATLTELQDAFYTLRDDLPIDVPDTEIIEALGNCFEDRQDASDISRMLTSEIMSYSLEYSHQIDNELHEEYRIADETGYVYSYDPAEWSYDEQACGWDGERWSDDWEH